MQKEHHGGGEKYSGELEATRDILKRHGIRGLYLGFGCTLLREFMAMGIIFTSFEFIKKKMSFNQEATVADKVKIMLAGGVAGTLSWIIGYPVDYIKTKLQSQDLDAKKFKGIRDCFQRNIRKYGPRIFFRGLVTVCIRSMPVNAVGFLVEE